MNIATQPPPKVRAWGGGARVRGQGAAFPCRHGHLGADLALRAVRRAIRSTGGVRGDPRRQERGGEAEATEAGHAQAPGDYLHVVTRSYT